MTSLLILPSLCRLWKCSDRIKNGRLLCYGAIRIMQLVRRVNPPEVAMSPLARRPRLAGNA